MQESKTMQETSRKSRQNRSIWYLCDEAQNTPLEPPRWGLYGKQHTWRPPTDLFECEDTFVVKVEIAGMEDGEFTISIEEQLLSVRGVRPDTTERRAYFQMEIPSGEFSTEVELPGPVKPDEIEAIYNDGFLKIVLPKARPYQIQIKS
jgi:HSP20 family protein